MSGLTISIVHYNNLEKYKDFRFDAEFFKPEYLALETILQRSNYTLFGDVVKEIRCGPFGSTLLADTYLKDGVIVARPFNIKQFTLERDNRFISTKGIVSTRILDSMCIDTSDYGQIFKNHFVQNQTN
ncbi:hypothetical protein U27_04095 [Candidatus Vecturithrix granuli]|uniref:Uncharacterized protein n=1 Tax=Vecturithrix granuli TaxID=1499967 RepID=A0A081BXS5_VECG1|nr:hypothetical protein U27_04095 [Candidatus Vecturithrix granuli]